MMPPLAQVESYAVIDAARDYSCIALARRLTSRYENLFAGEKGKDLEDVSPHLFVCDLNGCIASLVLGGVEQGHLGILIDSKAQFAELRKVLRKRQTIIRERDHKKVYFRYYDPRVLPVFLRACNREELISFFGPIEAFHCQGENSGEVVSFHLDNEMLVEKISPVWTFLSRQFEKEANKWNGRGEL